MLVKAARFVAAFIAAPFLITLLARLLPFRFPLWLPFLAVMTGAAGLWIARRWLRSLALGLACGTFAHAVFLLWLFGVVGEGLGMIG